MPAIEADLEDPATPAAIFARLPASPIALIMAHCESVDSGLLDTTIESFDRHFAVNARATWLLIRDLKASVIAATPLGRLGTPQDCANLVAFLCSPAGGWTNGQLLKSDGGI